MFISLDMYFVGTICGNWKFGDVKQTILITHNKAVSIGIREIKTGFANSIWTHSRE